MKENPNILFTRADKENVTVVLEKNRYTLKLEEILSDDNTYIKIKKTY